MTVLTLVLLNAIVQPFPYRFSLSCHGRHYSEHRRDRGHGHRTAQGIAGIRKTVEQLAEAISRHQAIALAAFLIIDVLALAFSSKISLHIYGSKDI